MRIGSKHNEETKRKIGLVHKGKTISAETREKMRRTHKMLGTKPPSGKGRVYTEDQKERMSLARKRFWNNNLELRMKKSLAWKNGGPSWRGG